jgi:starch synthase (maltosyl-transferring)
MSHTDRAAGRQRVVIENIEPAVEGGRFAIKRIQGEPLDVRADIFTDGHDEVRALLLWRPAGEEAWRPVELKPTGNDAWTARLLLGEVGRFEYTCEAWVDHFRSWHRDLKKRVAAGQDVSVELEIGARLVDEAALRASGETNALGPFPLTVATDDAAAKRGVPQRYPASLAFEATIIADGLHQIAAMLRKGRDAAARFIGAEGDALAATMDGYPDRSLATRAEPLAVVVDREKARFSAWYEMFPRSATTTPGGHGTFRDLIARLPYVAEMGFDILYLPPIHPIGAAFRKGKNNALVAAAGEPGSPWAIGAPEGGHKAIHSQLGTLAEFRELVAQARQKGIDVALDVAFQCSPDHPYVTTHPSWFRARPDGTIQYAENPPKKYQDIYPFDFETDDWQAQWQELQSVFEYWLEQGVRVFRVDNPHTKPFAFWEATITSLKRKYPDAIFLSEAFTRPKIMYRLAKIGFTQSYTYFTWRNGRQEFVDYFTELTKTKVADYFMPNLWPNTPDILPEHLQRGGRPAFIARLVLAATLSASYGIYGPAYELGEHLPLKPGSEEYLNSEKYEIRLWDLKQADSLRGLIARVNRIRRENASLQDNRSLQFHGAANDQLLCYSKRDSRTGNLVVVVVNLDFYSTQRGFVDLPLDSFGLAADRPYEMWDMLSDARFTWRGARNYVELNPERAPAHVFSVRQG